MIDEPSLPPEALSKEELAAAREFKVVTYPMMSDEYISASLNTTEAQTLIDRLLATIDLKDARISQAMVLLVTARAEADDCVKWGHSKMHAGDLCDEINTFLVSLDATGRSEHQRLVASLDNE